MAHLIIPLLYTIAEDPYPTAMIYPSGDEDKLMSETRIQPLIRACPATARQIPENQDKFKLRRMIFPGMALYMLSAGTLGDAKQKQLRNIFFDEIEAYTGLEGKAAAEGDIISLYEERAKGYWDIRKIFISSSRVVIGGALDKRLAMSEVVFKWHVECPFCQSMISLSEEIFHFEDPGEGDRSRIEIVRRSAHFICVHCGNSITDQHRGTINDRGDWLPGYIQIDPFKKTEDEDASDQEKEQYIWKARDDLNIADCIKPGSYIWKEFCNRHKPSMVGWTDLYTSYSPWVSFADIAQKSILSQGSFEDEKVYQKDWWCRVARPKVHAVRSTELLKLMDDRKECEVPIEAVALVAGIDNQKDRLYVVVWAVNRMEYGKEEVWLVYYKEIPKTGFSDKSETDYSGLAHFLDMKFCRQGSETPSMVMWRAGMDTGGTKNIGSDDSMTQESYSFLGSHCFKLPGRVWGIKGSAFSLVLKGRPPVVPGKVKIRELFPIQFVDTSYYSHMIARLIEKGRMHLHKNTDHQFMSHLTGEVLTQDDKGKMAWTLKAGVKRIDYRAATKYAFAMCETIENQNIKNVSLNISPVSTTKQQAGSSRISPLPTTSRDRISQLQRKLRDRVR